LEEYDSITQIICEIVQTDLTLMSTNQESYASIGPFDHNFGPNNYRSTNHFSTNIFDDLYFTLNDIYGLPSKYLETFQAIEALWPLLMVMSGSYSIDKSSKHDQIKFHHKILILIPCHQLKLHFLKYFGVFNMIVIYDWLELCYLASSIANLISFDLSCYFLSVIISMKIDSQEAFEVCFIFVLSEKV